MNFFFDLRMFLCFLFMASPLRGIVGIRDDGYNYLYYGPKPDPENVKVSAITNKKSNINEVSILVKPYPFSIDGKNADFKINDLLCAADCQLVRIINISTEIEDSSAISEIELMAGRPFSLSTLKDWCTKNCNERATWPKHEPRSGKAKSILGKRQNSEPLAKEKPSEGYFAPLQIPKNVHFKPYKPQSGRFPVLPNLWRKIESFSSIIPLRVKVFNSFVTRPPFPNKEHPASRFYRGPPKHEAPPLDHSKADVGFRLWGGVPKRGSLPVPEWRRKISRNSPVYRFWRRSNFVCSSCRGMRNERKPMQERNREEESKEKDRDTEEAEYEEVDAEESECGEDGIECNNRKEVFLRLLKGILNLISDKSFRAKLQKSYCNKAEKSLVEEKPTENNTIFPPKKIN